jgi:hypothetical protein
VSAVSLLKQLLSFLTILEIAHLNIPLYVNVNSHLAVVFNHTIEGRNMVICTMIILQVIMTATCIK